MDYWERKKERIGRGRFLADSLKKEGPQKTSLHKEAINVDCRDQLEAAGEIGRIVKKHNMGIN